MYGRAWFAVNPDDHDLEQTFDKIGELSWRALVPEGGDVKSPRQILIEIGVNPDDYLPPVTSAGEVGRLKGGSEPIFRAGGQPWRWKGCTAFALPMLHAAGEDIDPFLDWAIGAGLNTLRCLFGFHYIPSQMGRPDFLSTPDQTRAFLMKLASR